MRPQSIINFERAYLASVLVGLINLAVSWNTKIATMENDPRFSGNPQMAQIGSGMMIGMAALGVLISLLLWYFAARRGSEVAKWILVVFLAFSAVGVASSLAQFAVVGAVSTGLALLAFALNAYAVWMLFKPDAKAWMRGTPAGTTEPVE
ncbi:hypothetical protein M9978_00870 [Sphingomonas sp. MG17]|uniref:Uncharacterized protein n=1 Tax=Sphingomonas tagetis TaxID=2949092 RepID=A0A9X2HD88_9SPHN|nr:hypothetical protein [Sphingomonas tagetis]MCP3728971.1 hypothetical protein [Sphingomonas tagetis]